MRSRQSCFYCHKEFRTSQAVRAHIANKSKCQKAYNDLLTKYNAPKYDPNDPEDHPTTYEPPLGWEEECATFDDLISSLPEEQLPALDSMVVNLMGSELIPSPSALHVDHFPGEAGTTFGKGVLPIMQLHNERILDNTSLFHPFHNEAEWELAKHLMTGGMSLTGVDNMLKLTIIKQIKPSFKNKYQLLRHIDNLPFLGPDFQLQRIHFRGDLIDFNEKPIVEELELFYRDPIECIRTLIGNPTFASDLCFQPERIYVDENKMERIYNEMWTGDWWWETQEQLPSGATIIPIILSSDKTQLSHFSGDKAAWPVYLTIGNIKKSVRRKISLHAHYLLGYIPISKMKHFSKPKRKLAGQRLFHFCLQKILQTLCKAGSQGVDMTCADGYIRKTYPIVAAYVADYPEQCLVTCCKEFNCPICFCGRENLGKPLNEIFPDVDLDTDLWTPDTHLELLQASSEKQLDEYGIRPVIQPFWDNLPHTNIFRSMTPDILHQLQKGVFKDHLTTWCINIATSVEIDARFAAVPHCANLRVFSKGVSSVSQWTGTEYKQMGKVFLGLLAGTVPQYAMNAARSIMDFIYLAQYPSHSTTTLHRMQEALQSFHHYKEVFINLKCRENFCIPKLHAMEHYIPSIHYKGTADNFNTECSERLHIDFAKMAYRASNRKDYTIQMTKWLIRQEKMHGFSAYLQWRLQSQSNDTSHNGNQGKKQSLGRTYLLAKVPPFPNFSINQIQAMFCAHDFLPAVQTFVKNYLPNKTIPHEHTRFNLYKKITFFLRSIQQLDDSGNKDFIYATPETPSNGRKKAVPARFDTALVHYTPDAEETGAKGKYYERPKRYITQTTQATASHESEQSLNYQPYTIIRTR